MPDETAHDRQIDDQLAAFADQVLARDATGEPTLALEHEELRHLQEMVLRLKRIRTTGSPSPAFAARLRALIHQEWQRNGANHRAIHPGPVRLIQKVQRFFAQPRPRMLALQFAVAAVVLLVIVLFVSPLAGGAPLTGAAGVDTVLKPLVLTLGIVLVLFVIWLARSKDK